MNVLQSLAMPSSAGDLLAYARGRKEKAPGSRLPERDGNTRKLVHVRLIYCSHIAKEKRHFSPIPTTVRRNLQWSNGLTGVRPKRARQPG